MWLLFNDLILIVDTHLVLILLVFGILCASKKHSIYINRTGLAVGCSYLLVSRVLEVLVVLVVILDLLGRERVLCIDMIKVTIVVLLILSV